MKFEEPKNKNYAATVVEIVETHPLEGCDNVCATTIFGMQAIVGKDTAVGTIGIVFPAETQLSDEYCKENNLYRHNENNRDVTAKGYIEDSRRVKAVKFRGHPSTCLFMPLSSLKYLGVKPEQLEVGDVFDAIKGKEVCRKYLIREPGERKNHQAQPKRFNRVDTKFIPEHFDTENYFRNKHVIPEETEIIVTQKLHGTSIRIANTVVTRKLSLRDKVARFLGARIQETEYDYVYGSRKVIKDVNNPFHNHFYSTDIWSTEGEKLKGMLPENFVVYGELVGWTPDGAAIQTDYTYGLPEKTCALYIYRIVFINQQGMVTDLSWEQIKEFCAQRGLKYVPEVYRGKHKDFDSRDFMEKRMHEKFDNCVPLSHATLMDEGVCIRVDKLTPYILKAKAQSFLEHETKLMDKGAEDVESAESNPEV